MIRRVVGRSMMPTLSPGDTVLTRKRHPKLDDIVIARHDGREVIKRVTRIEADRYYLIGDNSEDSTDSRHYGFINKSDILGTIMIVLPKSVSPPKLVLPYGLWLGRVAAISFALMALVHLFRIDTFIPIIDTIVPGGNGMAIFISLVMILSEIFAIPFALRMKLSPLAHLMSGALVVFAPLWWLLLTIWALGTDLSTGQLGEFVSVPANTWAITVNIVWVVLGYVTLYALGYNRLSLTKALEIRSKK
jgi:nickel-type superoxide dismutase maturation protease